MKRHIRVVVAVFLMVLSGCASDGGTHFANNTRIVVDQQSVNQVNLGSQNAFAEIVWVNRPTKRVPAHGDTSD